MGPPAIVVTLLRSFQQFAVTSFVRIYRGARQFFFEFPEFETENFSGGAMMNPLNATRHFVEEDAKKQKL